MASIKTDQPIVTTPQNAEIDSKDIAVVEATHALHTTEEGIMTNAQVREEMFPFFSKPGMRCLMVCSAGYFATLLYG